jgi:hypothetical protein
MGDLASNPVYEAVYEEVPAFSGDLSVSESGPIAVGVGLGEPDTKCPSSISLLERKVMSISLVSVLAIADESSGSGEGAATLSALGAADVDPPAVGVGLGKPDTKCPSSVSLLKRKVMFISRVSALATADDSSGNGESAATLAAFSVARETLRIRCGQEAVRLEAIGALADRVYSSLPPVVLSSSGPTSSSPCVHSPRRICSYSSSECLHFCFCTRCVLAWILLFLILVFCILYSLKHLFIHEMSWAPFAPVFLNFSETSASLVNSSDQSLTNWTAWFDGDEFA